MLEIIGNIWDQHCDWLCVTTNGITRSNGCAVMGRGIALEAKNKYPGIDKILGQKIKEKGNIVSSLIFDKEYSRWIISFPTKNNWVGNSDIDLIEKSALDLKIHAFEHSKTLNHHPIVALPRPGCGNGGLNWEDVREVLSKILINDRFLIFSQD